MKNSNIPKICFIIGAFFFSNVAAEKAAVYGFKSIGILKTASEAVQENIESQLVKSGKYDVMSRSDMDKILNEQSFQLSGTCSDTACILKAEPVNKNETHFVRLNSQFLRPVL